MFKTNFNCQVYDQFRYKLFLGTIKEINIQCKKDGFEPLSDVGKAKFCADLNNGYFYFTTDFLLEPWVISHECNHCTMWMFDRMNQIIVNQDHTYIYLHDWLIRIITTKFRKQLKNGVHQCI